jgi:hypothetical protein
MIGNRTSATHLIAAPAKGRTALPHGPLTPKTTKTA